MATLHNFWDGLRRFDSYFSTAGLGHSLQRSGCFSECKLGLLIPDIWRTAASIENASMHCNGHIAFLPVFHYFQMRLLLISCTVVTKLILFVMLVFVTGTSLWPIPSTQAGAEWLARISFEICLVVLLCRCRDDDRAIHCFYRLFMRSFITPAFPFIFMHAAPSIHSFNHSFTSAAIYFIHTFIFSLISLSYTITVYCFVGCRDQNRHPHSPLPSSLTSQSILVIENNCCGHPIFGQGSIPWQLMMGNMMILTNKPSREF